MRMQTKHFIPEYWVNLYWKEEDELLTTPRCWVGKFRPIRIHDEIMFNYSWQFYRYLEMLERANASFEARARR